MRISAHTEGLDAARALIAAGADAIEHGSSLDDEAVRRMADQDMVLVPTLWLFTHDYDPATMTPAHLDSYRLFAAEHTRSFQRALRAGVKVAVGTDAVTDLPPADCLVTEMELMQAHGMSTAAVLRAATTGGAGVLGLADQIGRLAAGFQADVIAIAGDPLLELRALTRVDLVMQRGRLVISNLRPSHSGPPE
jgi:imidazolonepropionase-like amidohydrolase